MLGFNPLRGLSKVPILQGAQSQAECLADDAER